ncbi:neural cell adhesion molecule 1 [Diachasma alloeum]|uniref:neural cell adhesion molecule 1 n=1 Tax=Diachasma alloeum TaxID=454923 RepID=UPI000738329C|nr:neural cell adhesion molecule 1 [Diachasma alloeum]
MKTLLVMSVIALVGGELVASDVDEPIFTRSQSAVSGYKGRLSCDIVPPQRNDPVVMILWYREFTSKQPIFRVDARKSGLHADAPRWSDPKAFGGRATMRIDKGMAQLEINPVMSTDAGVYRCRVDFTNSPTKSQKVNFTVIVPPGKPTIYIGPDRIYSRTLPVVNEGGPLTLVCEVTGGSPPPRVIWYLGSKMLDDTFEPVNDEVMLNTHTIARVSREYATTKVLCRASNTDLIGPSTSEILLNVNLKPLEVNITNKQNHLLAVQTYEIECATSGSKPEAIITWWKGSHQVKHMAKKFTDTENVTRSILSYVATIEDDGKFLTCRAENPIVPDSGLEDKWKLVVHYVPVVTIRLGSGLRANDINEGDDVYFECDVKANPEAYKLGWFKDGRELHQNVSAGIRLPGEKSLVLQSVNRASAGEYACTAVNAEGSSTSRPVTLEVMYAPICKEGAAIQVVGALKPETISLVCAVQAKPAPSMYHWSFNNSGELSVPADRYGPSKSHSRIANQWHGSRVNYTLNDDREYGMVSCWAENTRGKQRTPCLFQIIQAGRPYPLQNCSTAQSTGPYGYRANQEESKPQESTDAEWLIVRCSEGFDGGLPLTSFELEVWSEENAYHINTIHFNRTERLPGHRHQGPIFEVVGLEPGRNYRLLVFAVNAKGKSEPVVLSSITLKGVAMYTTGRGSTDKDTDYSLLVACFAGGITAICILVVGVTVTLYRRNNATRPMKTQMHIVHCDDKDDPSGQPSTLEKARDYASVKEVSKPTARFKDPRESPIIDSNEENPDVIPSKLSGNYSAKPERAKEFNDLEVSDYPSPASVLHGKDTWIYPNGYVERPDATSPIRPSTLPVHRTHDIYTRSLRVQESCI